MRAGSWLSRARPAAALVVALAGLSAGVVTAVAPAYAAACTGKTGVTVVVDFTKLHGKVLVGCDSKHAATGLAALTGAGFKYGFVPRMPGFICTINHRPNPCNGAPAKAFWSYWHAKPHGTWTFSKLGAGSYHPKAGWVEGWAFGAGKPPRMSPP